MNKSDEMVLKFEQCPELTIDPYNIINLSGESVFINIGPDNDKHKIIDKDSHTFWSYPDEQYSITTLGDRKYKGTFSKKWTVITILPQPLDIELCPLVECPYMKDELIMSPVLRGTSLHNDEYNPASHYASLHKVQNIEWLYNLCNYNY